MEKIKCQHCGAEIEKSSKFCEFCGKPINSKEDEYQCSECKRTILIPYGVKSPKFCSECGNTLVYMGKSKWVVLVKVEKYFWN